MPDAPFIRESKAGIDVASLKGEDLYGILLKARGEAAPLPEPKIKRDLFAAEDFYERNLNLRWRETRVFSDVDGRNLWPDTSMHVNDFDELVDEEEPAYDYEPRMFDSEKWGKTSLGFQPIRSLDSVIFAWPGSFKVWSVPRPWLGVDKRSGRFQIRPNSGPAAAMPFTGYLLGVIGAGRGVPQSVYVDYKCGFTPDLLQAKQQDLLRGLRLRAVLSTFGIISAAANPGGAMSNSLSMDGLSRSKGLGGKYGAYSGIIERYIEEEKDIRENWGAKEKPIPCGFLHA